MDWKKSIRAAGLVTVLSLGLVACNTESSFSPQEIIDQALQETKEVTSYYGEYKIDMGEVGGSAKVKEWVKDGKRRIELTAENGEHYITVNNGSQILVYNVMDNAIQKLNFAEGQLDELGAQSPKDQAEMLLNMVKDSHEIKIAGEEKIAGRDTYHIVAVPIKEDTLFGDLEVWIDKKTWVTLKTTTISAGNKMATEYTKMEVDAKIDDSQFTIDIPEDAKVEEISTEDTISTTTIDEVKKQLGEFLIMPEIEGVTLSEILTMGVKERPEYSFEYVKDDQKEFSVSVFKIVESNTDVGAIPGEKEILVRGQKGTIMEQGDFRFISWQENGYQYGIIIENPELTKDDILAYAEQMSVAQ